MYVFYHLLKLKFRFYCLSGTILFANPSKKIVGRFLIFCCEIMRLITIHFRMIKIVHKMINFLLFVSLKQRSKIYGFQYMLFKLLFEPESPRVVLSTRLRPHDTKFENNRENSISRNLVEHAHARLIRQVFTEIRRYPCHLSLKVIKSLI